MAGLYLAPDDPPGGGNPPPGAPPASPPAKPEDDKSLETPAPEDLDGEEFDKDRALATIKNQRESEKALKAQVKQLQADLKVFQDKQKEEDEKKLSEQQKTEKKLTEATEKLAKLEAENTKLILRQEFALAVDEAGYSFVNAQAEKDAFAFLDGVEVKDSEVKGMKEAVKKLYESRPYFFAGDEREAPGTPPRGKKPQGKNSNNQVKEPVKIAF